MAGTRIDMANNNSTQQIVYCIHGPVDNDIPGYIVEDNGCNKVLVKFGNGEEHWCKYEWLEYDHERRST